MKDMMLAVVLGLSALSGPVPAAAVSTVDQARKLRADLAGPASATQVLTRWCVEHGRASPPVIRALRDRGFVKAPDGETRRALAAGRNEAIGYRHVRLTCGDQILSEADNWYLPGRLTPQMNRQLETSDTPFGSVVAPLNFRRQTLEALPLTGAQGVLRVRAVLISAAGAPFSLVVETYSRRLITPPDP
jgi:hypothetical protein